MSKEEIALQLTLKAIEFDVAGLDKPVTLGEKQLSDAKKFNAKQIYELYNEIFENIKSNMKDD